MIKVFFFNYLVYDTERFYTLDSPGFHVITRFYATMYSK